MKATFFSLPAHGHVNPTLPLVAELVRRGEAVDYWATEEFRAAVESTGARYREVPGFAEAFRNMDTSAGPLALAEVTFRLLPGLLELFKNVVERERPDYLVHDTMAVWGRLIAQMTGLPRATTFASFGTKPQMLPLPPLPLFLLFLGPRNIPANLRRLAFRKRQAKEIAKRFGVDELVFRNVISNPSHCNVVFTSERFQFRRDLLDDTYHWVGPTLAHRPPDPTFPLDPLDKRTVVYASLGTIFNNAPAFFRTCLEAFRGREEVLVLSIGKSVELSALGEIPPNCIVRSHVPQLDVLKRTSVFITHAGMNSVNEALSLNVPLLLYPQAADQFMVTRRAVQLGLGRKLGRRDLTPSRLYEHVQAVLRDPAIARNVAELGDSVRTAGGARRGADVILAWRDRLFSPVGSTTHAA